MRMFLVCLASVGLVVFVLWKKFTGPAQEGGMEVSPLAVAILAGILVVLAGIACRTGYKNSLASANEASSKE